MIKLEILIGAVLEHSSDDIHLQGDSHLLSHVVLEFCSQLSLSGRFTDDLYDIMNEHDKSSRPLLFLHRYGVIQAFLTSARALLGPVHDELSLREPIGVDPSGVPLPPDRLTERIASIPQPRNAFLMASCCVASANLGYAYEHTFRLLKYIDTGSDTKLRGVRRHKLAALYRELPDQLQSRLEDIYGRVKSHEAELHQMFGKPTEPPREPPPKHDSKLLNQLEHWDRNGLLHRSHYAYTRITGKSHSHVLIFIPLRSLYFIESILSEELAPRIGLRVRFMGG